MENNGLMVFLKRHWKPMIAVVTILIIVVAIIAVIAGTNLNNKTTKVSDNDDVLSAQLEEEKPAIVDAFNRRFQFMNGRYDITGTMLLNEGEYAAILLRLDPVEYKAVLVKDDNGWFVVGIPAIVLSYDDFPDLPKEIVRVINDWGIESEE